MALSTTQFKQIMKEYDAKRMQNKSIQQARIKTLQEKHPALARINDTISSASMEISKLLFAQPKKREELMHQLKQKIDVLKKEKSQFLQDNGYPQDYLDPIYTCTLCQDTGYIEDAKCSCLKQTMITVAYEQSNLKDILMRENFDTFAFDFYSKEVDPQHGISPYEKIQSVYAICKQFVAEFDTEFSNIILYGQAGLGKTFLCNSIAKAILDASYSVIYLSAFQLFRLFETYRFNNKEQTITYSDIEEIYSCDLLIIDDLGSEVINSFTSSELFNLLNTRLLKKNSTVVSTNLGPSEWSDYYSNRIVSRIIGNYIPLKLIGDDIRLKKYR